MPEIPVGGQEKHLFPLHRDGAMPSVTLHLVLAERALDELRNARHAPTFSLSDPESVNAFFQGALGPDLGYFPGGYRPLSDLAHCVRAADLTRTLVRSARTPVERAFALGWATHVLADQRIHPHVGRGVGEFRTGRRDRFVSGELDQAGHVRIETGLDAWASRRFRRGYVERAHPVFGRTSVRFLRHGFRRVYGEAPDEDTFLASHLAVVRLTDRALASIRWMGLGFSPGTAGLPFRALRSALEWSGRRVSRGVARRSLALAYLTPVPPRPWLRKVVELEVESFGARFRHVLDTDLEALENRNLDTGRYDPPGTRHPGTVRALRMLAGLRPETRPSGAVPHPA